jgi:5-methylcytosine-specific restriction protein A
MPTAPPQRCSNTDHAGRCGTLVTDGARCDTHKPKPWRTRSKHWGKGSTRKSRAFRAEHLRRQPNCTWCAGQGVLTPGTQVDHITPLSQGGAEFDHANAQTLCDRHHDLKTRAESSARQRARRRR